MQVTGLCAKSISNHFTKWQSGGSHERERGSGTRGKLNETQIESLLAFVTMNLQFSSRQLKMFGKILMFKISVQVCQIGLQGA